jgi:hypothetical protein
MVPLLMRRLYGSDDLFPDDRMNAYRPHQSPLQSLRYRVAARSVAVLLRERTA